MATFTFVNPSSSAYFNLELIKRASDGLYPTSSLQTAFISGSVFSSLTSSVTNPIVAGWTTGVKNGIGDVNKGYIWSIVVPPGTSSVVFTPGVTIPISESVFRGVGYFYLTGSLNTHTHGQLSGVGTRAPEIT
tara:strand:+ start:173 stop:571 length:399 start_codon:yes stop_codon:yes gene_type:complete